MADEGIVVESNAQEILQRFRRLPAAVRSGVLAGMRRGLLLMESRVRTGTRLKWRRGAAGLGGRLTSYARTNDLLDVDAGIGFRKTRGFPYELAQEFGAKAKAGKAMAIPLTPQARRAGSPRNFPGNLTLIKGSKNAVLIQDLGLKGFQSGRGVNTVQYVLVKSIPARLGFRAAVSAGVPDLGAEIAGGWRTGWRDA